MWPDTTPYLPRYICPSPQIMFLSYSAFQPLVLLVMSYIDIYILNHYASFPNTSCGRYSSWPVSYTHLDVYKRQELQRLLIKITRWADTIYCSGNALNIAGSLLKVIYVFKAFKNQNTRQCWTRAGCSDRKLTANSARIRRYGFSADFCIGDFDFLKKWVILELSLIHI